MGQTWANPDLWRIHQQLVRLADALEALVQLNTQESTPPPEPETPAGCLHPVESRMDLGTTATGEPEWECTTCRQHFP